MAAGSKKKLVLIEKHRSSGDQTYLCVACELSTREKKLENINRILCIKIFAEIIDNFDIDEIN